MKTEASAKNLAKVDIESQRLMNLAHTRVLILYFHVMPQLTYPVIPPPQSKKQIAKRIAH